MSEDPGKDEKPVRPVLVSIPDLPERVLDTYARLWQLETWLRRLVYVELRAAEGDGWSAKLSPVDRSREADKRLSHMPTPEIDHLSYSQFSALRKVIDEEWRLFESFLPPKNIWEAKLEEVAQVRHRVAHFRRGHEDDLQRVTQLLRDLDQGFWRFCTSFNDPHPVLPQSDDPVVSHFLPLDLIPWSRLSDGKWARVGMADPSEPLFVTVEALCRPWASWSTPVAGKPGLVYEVTIHARDHRLLDYRRLLESTAPIHQHVVYISLESASTTLRVTIPAVLGAETVLRLVEQLIQSSLDAITTSTWSTSERAVRALAERSSEYVLGPDNPLTFLSPDMPCSFFGV